MLALQILVLSFVAWTTTGEKEVPVSDLVPENGTLASIDFVDSLISNLEHLKSDSHFCSIRKSEGHEEDDKQKFCRIVQLCQKTKTNLDSSSPCYLFYSG